MVIDSEELFEVIMISLSSNKDIDGKGIIEYVDLRGENRGSF